MADYRVVEDSWSSQPTLEGAGVRLFRVFGNEEVPRLDPFLLLDDFHSRNPEDYMAGFPWHPHRGIETVTYMNAGSVEHGDSLGNKGIIGSGDVQWMTAGSGIIHQEMPLRYDGLMRGCQLWVNLPRRHKMTGPRYRGVLAKDIPSVEMSDGALAKLICGTISGKTGPVKGLAVKVEYFDVRLAPGKAFEHQVGDGLTAFAYVRSGSARFHPSEKAMQAAGELVLYGREGPVMVEAGKTGVEFLFAAGKPLGEPVAWIGPIVMNTREEVELAFKEYAEGTFVKA